MEARKIVDAYHWQRELGNDVIQTPHGRIVKNATVPDVWDANHASAVTAKHPDDIETLLGDVERHLSHTSWRVIHTDCQRRSKILPRGGAKVGHLWRAHETAGRA